MQINLPKKLLVNYSEIIHHINQIKSYKEGFLTNFFFGEDKCNFFIEKGLIEIVIYEKCVFIFRKDHDFYHLYFSTTNKSSFGESLRVLISQYPDNIFVSDIIGKLSDINEICMMYEDLGFNKYKQLYRMNRTENLDDIQQLDERVEYAKCEQTIQIKDLLEQHFDPYSEQLPTIDEIQNWIGNKKVLIIQEKEKVLGFVIFEINGLTSYLRYWFTHPEHRNKRIGSALLRRFFHECRTTKRQLFWVISDNDNAIDKYKHYGFKQEELFDQIMIKR